MILGSRPRRSHDDGANCPGRYESGLFPVFLPVGVLSDRVNKIGLLAIGVILLIVADLVLTFCPSPVGLAIGVALWGLHMGFTQGLLSSLVAHTASADLRGTAFRHVQPDHRSRSAACQPDRWRALGSIWSGCHVRGGRRLHARCYDRSAHLAAARLRPARHRLKSRSLQGMGSDQSHMPSRRTKLAPPPGASSIDTVPRCACAT